MIEPFDEPQMVLTKAMAKIQEAMHSLAEVADRRGERIRLLDQELATLRARLAESEAREQALREALLPEVAKALSQALAELTVVATGETPAAGVSLRTIRNVSAALAAVSREIAAAQPATAGRTEGD